MDVIIIFIAQYFIVIPVLIAVWYVWKLDKKRKIQIAKLSVIALSISYITAKILEHFITDPRPFVQNHAIKPLFAHVPDNGFPSDHTLITMTIAAIVFAYNKKLGILLAFFSFAIGFARVAADVHHPLDILGAALIGIVSTYLSYSVLTFISKKSLTM